MGARSRARIEAKPSYDFQGSDSILTPKSELAVIRKFRIIGLDPCGNRKSIVEARQTYTYPEQDGLELPWFCQKNEIVFVNPPYSEILTWFWKGFDEYREFGCEQVHLIPLDPTTRHWQFCWKFFKAACMVKERIPFIKMDGTIWKSGHASVYWYLGEDLDGFSKAFRKHGYIVIPGRQ